MPRDMSHLADPKESQDEKPKVKRACIRNTMHKVIKELEYQGYLMLSEIGGAFAGYNVFKREYKVFIDGISIPDNSDFWYWKPVTGKDANQFFQTFQEVIQDLKEAGDKSEAYALEDIEKCIVDKPCDNRSEVAQVALFDYKWLARENTNHTVTISGLPGYFKVIPKLEWFPKSLQKLNARDLLTLLPDPEAQQFMLMLGRIVCGANKTLAAEGVIEHTSRSYGILVGTEAGLGKSTLMGYICNALEALGFQVSMIHVNDTRFGWGVIAQSDLAFIDDLTDEVQKRLLQDVRIKSIVSNNTLKVEDKGVAAVDIRATSVLLGCTNLHNPSHYIGMDSGSTSRVNQLDTYNSSELAKRWKQYPDARTKPHWEALAMSFGVSTECLAAYLLRRSADYFLETCGYTWDDGRLFKDQPDRLEETVKAHRDNFRIDTSLRHSEELVYSVAHMVALAIAKSDESDRKLFNELLEHLDFSPKLLVAILRLFTSIKKSTKLPKEYQKLDLENASWDCKGFISQKLNDLDRLPEAKSSEDSFTAIVKELRSNKGFGYPMKTCHYTPQWLAVRRMIPMWVEEYQETVKAVPLTQPLRLAVAEVHKIFNELQ